jgi:enoyl-CoA hydratase/carnithine racemase
MSRRRQPGFGHDTLRSHREVHEISRTGRPEDEAMPESTLLREEREGPVAWLILNRPRALNALDEPLVSRLDQALDRLAMDPELGALVLTGSGTRAFCFGADLDTLDADDAAARRARFADLLPRFQAVIRRLHELPVPSLAVLNGFATGAGLDLALACDMRIAGERTKLATAFLGLGLVPDGGGTYHLPLLVGTSRALEMILVGDPIDAQSALAMGLVNQVVPSDRLTQAARDLAARLARAPRPAAAYARRLVRENPGRSLADALAAEAAAQLACAGSEAFAQALKQRRGARAGRAGPVRTARV